MGHEEIVGVKKTGYLSPTTGQCLENLENAGDHADSVLRGQALGAEHLARPGPHRLGKRFDASPGRPIEATKESPAGGGAIFARDRERLAANPASDRRMWLGSQSSHLISRQRQSHLRLPLPAATNAGID